MSFDPEPDPQDTVGQNQEPSAEIIQVPFRVTDPQRRPAKPDRPWTHQFDHRGRRYRLFKREPTRDAPFYIRVMVGGAIHKKSLEVNSAEAAVDRAKLFIDQVRGQKWTNVDRLKARQSVSTLAELLKVYSRVARVQPVTLKNNLDSVRWIFRTATGAYDPAKIRLTEFSARLVQTFQEAYEAAAVRPDMPPEVAREARDRALRTSRSVVRQARSLFNRRHRLLESYEQAGLNIPAKAIFEFMSAHLAGRDRKPEYFPPSDEVVQQAFAEIEKQRTRPTVYVAFWLAVGAGLRRSEIGRMRWEYIVDRQGKVWISGSIGKDGERIEVPLQDRAAKALAPFRKPAGKCIEQDSLEWARKLNNWMESQGWATEKKMHELRSYTGSLIYREDPVAAMMFLRHKSIRQTEQFYVRYSKGHKNVQVL